MKEKSSQVAIHLLTLSIYVYKFLDLFFLVIQWMKNKGQRFFHICFGLLYLTAIEDPIWQQIDTNKKKEKESNNFFWRSFSVYKAISNEKIDFVP